MSPAVIPTPKTSTITLTTVEKEVGSPESKRNEGKNSEQMGENEKTDKKKIQSFASQ